MGVLANGGTTGKRNASVWPVRESGTYFHFPPLAFNLFVSRPMYVAIPRLGGSVSLLCLHVADVRVGAPFKLWEPRASRLNMSNGVRETTYWTPKSPVEKTSILFNPKHANISTLHRPRPRTATSFSMSSSSLALTSICAVSSPFENFSASPEMYSALRCESPAVRSVGRSFAMT